MTSPSSFVCLDVLMTDALTFNTEAEIVVRRREGEVVGVTVAAPVLGRPLQTVTFRKDRDPLIVDLLRRIAAGTGAVDVDLDEPSFARLVEVGLLLPEDRVSIAPRFRCSPLDPPRDLLPQRARRSAALGERLHVSPTLRYENELRPPAEGCAPRPSVIHSVRRAEVNVFAEGCAWARIEHPDVPVPSFLSIDAPERELFRSLRPGDREPDGLDPDLRRALAVADVLVDLEDLARRREAWARAREEAGVTFRRDRYAVVRGLIHPTQIAASRRYYRDLIAGGRVHFEDRQVALRYREHNELLARYLHRQLAGFVADVAGAPMQPSYVYFGSYRPGAVLRPHRDRPQCDITISLLLDYEPDPEDVSPWSLWLGLDDDAPHGRAAAIDLGLGDGVIYRGTQLCHWRHALPEGHASTSVFLHYVPADFAGSLD